MSLTFDLPCASDVSPIQELGESADSLPSDVEIVLTELRNIFDRDGVISAILTGSAARSELSFCVAESGVILRSDIELYVICDDPARIELDVQEGISSLESRYADRWPDFHIDVAYMPLRKFRALPPWVRHFELKSNGRILMGKDLLPDAPDVTLENLDWRELNDTVLWQLVKLLRPLPVEWLTSQRELTSLEVHRIARVVLNIATWALPGVGVLLPSFRERIAYWNRPDVQSRLSPLGLSGGDEIRACLRASRTERCELTADDLFAYAARVWSIAYEAAVGSRETAHQGRGLGFSKQGILRRLRAAYRARAFGATAVWNTLRRGAYSIAARRAHELSRQALELLSRHSSGAEGLRPSEIARWESRRAWLARYVDGVLVKA